MKKPHLTIDVKVFREILKGKYCSEEEKGSSKSVLLEIIQNITKEEIKVKGVNIDRAKAIEKINFRQLGYKQKSDAKITYRETITDTIITIEAKNIYELEDNIQLPKPSNNKQKQYLSLMSDTFERLKIKAENVLEETEQSSDIKLYASKNIQNLGRTYYDAKTLLKKYKNQNGNKNQNFVYVQSLFIINSLLYFQKMFSTFNKDEKFNEKTLYSDLFLTIGPTMISEPTAEYGTANNKQKIKWKFQVNQLITLAYDLMKAQAIDVNEKQLQSFILKNFVDKNGKELNPSTIYTALKDYRPEKRAKGKKRIEISRYLQ